MDFPSVKKIATKPVSTKDVFIVAGLAIIFFSIPLTIYLAWHGTQLTTKASGTLTVNVSNTIHPFTSKMLGVGLVNWEHSWGKPYPNQIPGLQQAFSASKVGLIRYAGGNWANYVGFDPTQVSPAPYTTWTHNGMTYYFNYGTAEISSVQSLAQSIGADVMTQVNISNNDPSMWKSMVAFTNSAGKYPIRYWEMGNELDYQQSNDPTVYVSPADYGTRMSGYQQQMAATDPSIKFVGAAQAAAVQASGNNSALSDYFFTPLATTKTAGKVMDSVSYHWYMNCNVTNLTDVLRYRWYNSDGTPLLPPTLWNNAYSRYWADAVPQAIKSQVVALYPGLTQGITELNNDACNFDNVYNSNHINALWFSDVLGRLAYNGLDYATAYEGYGGQGYSLLYPDDVNNPTRVYARPSYYAYLMYAKYFGNTMVESHSYKDDDISIWASTDTNDSGKLKLRITNMTANPITAPVSLTGFNASTGTVYVLQSSNPTDTSANSNLDPNQNTTYLATNINGAKIDAMNVNSSVASIVGFPITVNGTSFSYTFPAYSSTAIILSQSSVNPTPTADIKANTSDGPLSIGYNTAVTLSWNSTNVSSCSVSPGGWTGTSNSSQTTGNLTATTTYTLSCTGSNGNVSDSVTINVGSPPAPTVDIKANNSDGPISITTGTSTNLSWSSTNASSCSASGGWSGVKATSGTGVSTGNLIANTTFTLTCTGSGGTVSDSVTVNVTQIVLPDLKISQFSLSPASPTTGQTVVATINITNSGQGNIANLFWVDVYSSQLGSVACVNPNGEAAKSFTTLAAGSATGNFTLTFTAPSSAGSYTARIFADSDCQITEADEANNQNTLVYSVVNPVSVPVPKIGDLNNDNLVNIFDLSILLSKWGIRDIASDLNKNGLVDIYDLSILLSRWGS